MNSFEIKESAESTARSIVKIFYYFNVVIIGIAIIAGVVVALSEGGWAGLLTIVLTIVVAIWYLLIIVLFKALLDIFINISIKLDNGNKIVAKVQKIEMLLAEMSSNTKQQLLKEIVEEEKPNPSQEKPNADIKEKPHAEESKIEMENEILGFLIAGEELKARHVLMLKRGFSLKAAIDYIDNLKEEANIQ